LIKKEVIFGIGPASICDIARVVFLKLLTNDNERVSFDKSGEE
jgi:hypothetical protein